MSLILSFASKFRCRPRGGRPGIPPVILGAALAVLFSGPWPSPARAQVQALVRADSAQDGARVRDRLPGFPPTLAVPPGDDFTAAVAEAGRFVAEFIDEQGIPGASVAVGFQDRVVWSQGFGWASLEHRTPVTPLSRFRVGSVSKTLTSMAVGVLVEEGRLDLDAPVQTYLPHFPEKRWPITSRQLGGHTAGVRHYMGLENLSARPYATVLAGLEIFDEDALLFEPGTDYAYSSYGWNLLSAVVEAAAGVPFLDFMRDEVFEPLGLNHTVPDVNSAVIPHRVDFYVADDAGTVMNAPYVDNSYKWAGGGFLSTPEDLVRFGQAVLDGGRGVLSPETLAMLQEPQTLRNGESTDYGIGWRRYPREEGADAVGHSGGSVGGGTLFLIFPELDLVVAGVVNTSASAGEMVMEVARIFEASLSPTPRDRGTGPPVQLPGAGGFPEAGSAPDSTDQPGTPED